MTPRSVDVTFVFIMENDNSSETLPVELCCDFGTNLTP